MKIHLKAFGAGFLSTLVFHQGTLFFLNLLGMVANPPYNFSPTFPLGVPSIISLSFFGGLWGIPIWQLAKNQQGIKHWLSTFILGALGPTIVAMLVVFPLKDIPVMASMWVGGFILNGMWGIGNSAFMKLFKAQ